MRRRSLAGAVAVLVFVLAAIAPAGCARSPQAPVPAPSTAPSASAEASPAGIPPATSTASRELGGGAAAGTKGSRAAAKGLSAADANALDQQLTAIQSELDSMSVPSDKDFNSISSGLK